MTDGQLRKRGNIWWIRYYRNGRRLEESARTDKWEAARDLLRTREGDVAKGAPVSPKIGRLRFEDAAADLVTDYRINAKRSIAHVERHVSKLTAQFAGRRMVEIAGAEVRRYVDQHTTRAAVDRRHCRRATEHSRDALQLHAARFS